MNDGSRAVAEDGGSKMVSEDQPQDQASFNAEHSATSSDQAAPVPPVDLERAPVALRLRAAREALGLNAKDIAQRTRITLRHVEAIEAGDYAAMPGRPYAIGFARGYARAVGLDDTVIAEAVRAELEGSAPRPEPRVLHQFEVGDPSKTPSRLVSWLALLLIGAILAMGAVFWRSYYAPAVSLPSLAEPAGQGPASLTRSQANVSPAGTAASIANGPVVFTALEEGIWVKFYDGQGRQLMQKQLAKGEAYTLPADAEGPKLWTGRPDALSISIGGQAIPRLADTEKVMKDVPVDAASLRGRSNPPAAPAAAPVNAASANSASTGAVPPATSR
jgi:transcriptional regulator with XRE-family HTH domain